MDYKNDQQNESHEADKGWALINLIAARAPEDCPQRALY